jgi:tripartite-type tricarboxylate transporter receptor subunit TctC
MKLPRRRFLHLAAGAAAMPAVSRIAWGQAYPSRPMRLIISVAPGSSPDILGRLMSQWLSERLGQPIHRREPAGRRRQYRHRGGRQGAR